MKFKDVAENILKAFQLVSQTERDRNIHKGRHEFNIVEIFFPPAKPVVPTK